MKTSPVIGQDGQRMEDYALGGPDRGCSGKLGQRLRTDHAAGGAGRVIARRSLIALSLAFALSFFALAAARLGSSAPLEWVEVALSDHVTRVLRGEPVYVAPSVEFVPCIYTPLYYYVCALASKTMGVAGFLPLRLVSLLSTTGVVILVARGVQRETRSRLSAIVASGLFLASYGLVDFWLDLGRVDALFLVLLSACLYLLRFSRSRTGAVVAALLGTLAIQSKQAALVALMPVVLHQLLSARGRGRWFVGVLVATSVAAVAVFGRDGWYWYYVFELPARHHFATGRIVMFWLFDFVPWFAPSLVLVVWTRRLPRLRFSPDEQQSRRFWTVAGAGLVATAWVSWFHAGAARNVFLPACLAASVMAGFTLAAFRRRARELPAAVAASRETFGYGCLVAQFALLLYNPADALPRKEPIAAGVATVITGDADVWLPAHGHLDTRPGHISHAHWAPVMDVLEADDAPGSMELRRAFAVAVDASKFDAIVLPQRSALVDALCIGERLQARYEWRSLTALNGKAGEEDIGVWTVLATSRVPSDLPDFTAAAPRLAPCSAARH